MNDRSLKYTILFLGIGVVVFSVVLRFIFPSEAAWMPEGFSSPILAFEFLQSDSEVIQFFGAKSPERDEWVSGMYWGHQADYFYLLVYSSFIAGWALSIVRQTKNKLFYAVIILSYVAAFGDVMENRALVDISSNLDVGQFGQELRHLHVFTWIKWGCLSLALLGLSPYMIKERWLGKILTFVGIITVILGVLAFLNRSLITSYFALGISLQFLLLIVLAVVRVFKTSKQISSQ